MEKYMMGKYQIRIEQDDDASNPRTDWDNFGKMVCFHSRYRLGDPKHGFDRDSASEFVEEFDKSTGVIMPLFLYDHSGISISTSRTCQWDSSCVGFIYADAEMITKEYGDVNAETLEKATKRIEGEIETYDTYLRGDVYSFGITCDGEQLDSCSGFYGMDDVKKEAESIVKSLIEQDEAKQAKVDALTPEELQRVTLKVFYQEHPAVASCLEGIAEMCSMTHDEKADQLALYKHQMFPALIKSGLTPPTIDEIVKELE